jgi:hypothetical protein
MSALEYPTAGRITRASAARPYLAIRVGFDVREIAEVIIDGAVVLGGAERATPAVFVGVADPRLLGCLSRLLQLRALDWLRQHGAPPLRDIRKLAGIPAEL